ncbi:MAG: hypothetical protein HQ501_11215 [Rhodospirillales bacterium]|nr:hypothetical protein [Rhodospirillales bacterium]
MVFSLTTPLNQRLDGLLTNTSAQARDIAFNIQFNNLQNTTIGRMNGEIEKVANVEGNQRELDSLRKTYNKFVADRASISKFGAVNQANRDRLTELGTLVSDTFTAFASNDENVTASELTTYNDNLTKISALSDRLVELSHAKFVDGNNITRIRTMVSDLQNLTAVEGIIDVDGTDPTTNDNLAITDLLRDIVSVSGNAADTSQILEYLANDHIYSIDAKLRSTSKDMNEVNIFRSAEIEYEIQMIRTKYATFLQAIEISYDLTNQGTNALVDALKGYQKPEPGSFLSIFA